MLEYRSLRRPLQKVSAVVATVVSACLGTSLDFAAFGALGVEYFAVGTG